MERDYTCQGVFRAMQLRLTRGTTMMVRTAVTHTVNAAACPMTEAIPAMTRTRTASTALSVILSSRTTCTAHTITLMGGMTCSVTTSATPTASPLGKDLLSHHLLGALRHSTTQLRPITRTHTGTMKSHIHTQASKNLNSRTVHIQACQ